MRCCSSNMSESNGRTDIAQHWRGGSGAVVERKTDKRPVLLYASEWDSPESARKMFEAYREVLKGKWKQMTVATDTPSSLTGSGDDGDFASGWPERGSPRWKGCLRLQLR